MLTVELIYEPGCPHVAEARAQLETALARVGIDAVRLEHDASAPDAPTHLRELGSPTILVDGRDVAIGVSSGGSSCRLYPGHQGAPPLEWIVAALRASLLERASQ
jgi:hypothetical protein